MRGRSLKLLGMNKQQIKIFGRAVVAGEPWAILRYFETFGSLPDSPGTEIMF